MTMDNGIAVDEAGNTHVTGYFNGTATFGSQTLTTIGGNDIFVAKLDLRQLAQDCPGGRNRW